MHDIAFVGHFTRDTIADRHGESVRLGGAYYYGCHVAWRMGLRVAVYTRLARQDDQSVREMQALGVSVFPTYTPESTNLRIAYPTDDPDQRVLTATGSAGPFTIEDISGLQAHTVHIGASIRGEVPVEIVGALREKARRISLDVQGFIRVNQEGRLVSEDWPEMPEALRLVDVLKTDSTEVTFLAGETDLKRAAAALAALGPREVLVTHSDGLLVLDDGTFHEAPWLARSNRGRTGRGDTCTAAYLGRRLTHGSADATRFAAAVTGRKIETPGPFTGDIGDIECQLASGSTAAA